MVGSVRRPASCILGLVHALCARVESSVVRCSRGHAEGVVLPCAVTAYLFACASTRQGPVVQGAHGVFSTHPPLMSMSAHACTMRCASVRVHGSF